MESAVSSASSEFLNRNEIVRAGAGAGKTYSLTHKVMDLADEYLSQHGRLPRLVVTTFTRKATQELRERLMLLALEERPHLLAFASSRSYLMVSTIHGVMDVFLKRHGAVLPLEPGFRFLSNPEVRKLSRQTLRAILIAGKEGGEWNQLLETFSFHNLVKFCRRIGQIRSENPQARPFSNEDMEREFKTRASRAALAMAAVSLQIRSETDKVNWLSIADAMSLLSGILKSGSSWQEKRQEFINGFQSFPTVRKPGKGTSPVSLDTIDRAKECRELAKELMEPNSNPEFWKLSAEIFLQMENLSREFCSRLRLAKLRSGTIEISDLEVLAMDCLRGSPEAAQSFAAEWDHWLIDEFQDTSPFQVALLDKVVADRPKFIVGDPQQSIYLFRGARSEVFHEREQEIANAGGRSWTLSVNRRSKPELLQLINDFFASFKPPFRAMEAHFVGETTYDPTKCVATFFLAPQGQSPEVEDEAAGEVACETSFESKEPSAPLAETDPELTAIVSHVQSLLARGVRLDEICVLARTKKTLIEVAETLGSYRLAAHVHAGAGFYDRREVRDALAFLKFLANPHDDFTFIELARSPWFQIPDSDLAAARKRPAESLWLAMNDCLAEGAVNRLRAALQDANRLGYTEAFRQGLINSGYIDFAQAADASGRREANLWKLIMRLRDEETKPGFNPIEFVRSTVTDLKSDEGNAEDDATAAVEPERINLMTVHAAKGLEFKHVIVPRLHARPRLTTFEDLSYDEDFAKWGLRVPFGDERETFATPCAESWIRRFQDAEIQEHARVLYVALTRAIDSIYLSWSGEPQSNSWASLIRLDLNEGMHVSPCYSYQVSRELSQPHLPAQTASSAVKPRPLWQVAQSSSNGQVSVSNLVALLVAVDPAHVRPTTLTNPQRIQSAFKSQATGTGVHRLLELLKYPMSNERRRSLIEKWFPERTGDVAKAIEFVQSCQQPPLFEMIQKGEVEWGFTLLANETPNEAADETAPKASSEVNGELIEGQIDLWARVGSGELWIVDYKTGSEDYQDKAFLQMSIYAKALLKAGIARLDEPIFCAAVYPFSRQVITRRIDPAAPATTSAQEPSP